MNIFQEILINPLLNSLVWLYDVLPGHDLGIAIIILTIVIKVILLLPSRSSIRSQHRLQDLQPKVDAIRKKYPNREEQGKKLMELYRENKINPLSSCLPLLIQLPIIYALFRAFLVIQNIDPGTQLLSESDLAHLYEPLRQTYTTTPLDTTFLGLVDLAATKNYILAVLAGVSSFFQVRMMQSKKPPIKDKGAKDESIAAAMTKQSTYILPIVTIFFGISFPAGITLYWLASTLFTIGQQWFIVGKHKHPTVEQEIQKV